jgi:hypothetical protein
VLLLISLLLRFKLESVISSSAFMLNERELVMCSLVGVLAFCHSRTKCFRTTKFKVWNRTVITLFLYEIVKHRIMIVLIRQHVVDFQLSADFLHLKALFGNADPSMQTVLSKQRRRNISKK